MEFTVDNFKDGERCVKLAKAIIFDLDDTLLSYREACDVAWKKVGVEFAAKYDHLFDSETLLRAVSEASSRYWSDKKRDQWGRLNMFEARRIVVASAFEKLDIKNKLLSDDIADTYSQLQYEYIKPFPGAIETLEALVKMNVRLILITNGSTLLQWAKIKRFKLQRYFEECLVEGDLDFGKPDIRIFNMAIKRLGLPVEKVWSIGDNLEWDIQIPQMLGMYAVWNDYKSAGLPENSLIVPDRIINGIHELL